MSDELATAFSKHPHRQGCDGDLYRQSTQVYIDRTGRVGNGGILAHDYCCNRAWDGCAARVLVTEHAVRQLAVAVEQRASLSASRTDQP